jgi:hypothetical protein
MYSFTNACNSVRDARTLAPEFIPRFNMKDVSNDIRLSSPRSGFWPHFSHFRTKLTVPHQDATPQFSAHPRYDHARPVIISIPASARRAAVKDAFTHYPKKNTSFKFWERRGTRSRSTIKKRCNPSQKPALGLRRADGSSGVHSPV